MEMIDDRWQTQGSLVRFINMDVVCVCVMVSYRRSALKLLVFFNIGGESMHIQLIAHPSVLAPVVKIAPLFRLLFSLFMCGNFFSSLMPSTLPPLLHNIF